MIEWSEEGKGSGKSIRGKPSLAGLIMMLEYYGWSIELFDWAKSGLIDGEAAQPRYLAGTRVTLRCTR